MREPPETRPSLPHRLRDTQDEQAWEQFVQSYTPQILRYCQQRGLVETDGADVAQEVMVTVSQRIGQFEHRPQRGTFRSWLFKITRSRFNDFLDERRRQPTTTNGDHTKLLLQAAAHPDQEAAWDENYKRWLLEWACARARPEFAEPTWQAFWQLTILRRSGSEVAQALGLTVGAVYIAKCRVLARLKKIVEHAPKDSTSFPNV
jgi:RNA polymerase sigma-70 factor (ECF subfamily)